MKKGLLIDCLSQCGCLLDTLLANVQAVERLRGANLETIPPAAQEGLKRVWCGTIATTVSYGVARVEAQLS